MKELLEIYYKQVTEKANCESVIADNFQFIDGDMTKTGPLIGKKPTSTYKSKGNDSSTNQRRVWLTTVSHFRTDRK